MSMVRRQVAAAFGVLVCALVFGGVPALGAPPETPETGKAEPVAATTATLHGVLNPGGEGEPGSYQFSYAPSETECAGIFAPEKPRPAAGTKKEAVSLAVTGLEPSKRYAFCVVARNLMAEPSFGAAVTFKTLGLKPSVDSESALVTSTGAMLEAQVNPNNQETMYVFEYAKKEKGGVLEGPVVKLPGASALSGFGDQTASVPTGAVLESGTTYFDRVVASNATGLSEGAVKSFTTVPAPHTEAVSAVTATTATFNGTLTPLNATVGTEYFFVYGFGGECASPFATAPASAGTGSGSKAVSAAVSELEPSTSYAVCLVSKNVFGLEVAAPPVPFKTSAAPPGVLEGSETTSGVTPFEATLEARVNPNNQETTYSFQYGTSPTLTGATTLNGAGPLSGFSNRPVSAATGHVLVPGTTYHYRLVAENAAHEKGEGKIEEFKTPALTVPVVEGEESSSVTPFEATLGAHVNPDYQETMCKFEYATSEAVIGHAGATTVACPTPLGSGGPGVETSVKVSGLTPNTLYYYRLVATNGTGPGPGEIKQFTTRPTEPPIVEEERVAAIASKDAKLEARINPNYLPTTFTFEYATKATGETLEGTIVKVAGGSIPADFAANFAAQQAGPVDLASNLAPQTPYFYRVVAENTAHEKTLGKVAMFTTLIAPLLTTSPAQSVTRTTATLSGTVNPLGVETSYRYAYTEQSGYEEGLKKSPANPYVYGKSTPETPIGSENTVKATTPLEVGALAPGTHYHYAVIATTTQETGLGPQHATAIGPDQTFTTSPPIPPIVSGTTITSVTQSTATITATIEGRSMPTRWEILLGSNPSNLQFQAAGHTENTTEPITANLGPLTPNTTYHYKVTAANPDGEAEPAEGQFTTTTAPPPPGLTPITTTPILTPSNTQFPQEEKVNTTTHRHHNTPKTCAKKHPKNKHATTTCEHHTHKHHNNTKPNNTHTKR